MDSGYYGIIPREVRHCDKIKPNSKLVYSEVTACLESNGVCIKTNAYFSRKLGLTKTTISKCVTELRVNNFIFVDMEYEQGTLKFIKRYITPTPLNLRPGVEETSENTHTLKIKEGNEDSPLESGKTPVNERQMLLLHNNKVNKVYINKEKLNTYATINDEQEQALKSIVYEFYTTQNRRFPNMIRDGWQQDTNLVNGSINTLYDLIKKDGNTYEDVRDTMRYALHDSFYSSKILNLRHLRNKAENGYTKFQNLHHKFKFNSSR
tara:strand:+ start:278 stop:1069 length:792 start_codon:yes stop_codon:yes gene_type:complete